MLAARIAASHAILTSEPRTRSACMMPLTAGSSVSNPWVSVWVGLSALLAVLAAMIATRTMWQSSVSTSAGPFRNQQVRELLGMVNAHDSGQAGCLAHCLRLGGVGVLFCVMVLSSRDLAHRSQSSERIEACRRQLTSQQAQQG